MGRARMVVAWALAGVGLAATVALPIACQSFADAGEDGGVQEAAAEAGGGGEEATTTTPYEAAVLADRPAVFWRFAAKSTTQPDRGSANVAATVSTDVRTSQASLVGDAADKSVRLVIGDTITSAATTEDWTGGNRSFSMECWVQVLKTASQSDILFRGSATNGVGIGFDSSGRLKATRADNGVATTLGSTLTPLTAGANHHIVVTYDGASLALYLDGKVAENATSTLSLASAKLPITIGTTTPATPSQLDAFVDEVALYDHVLTPERVRAHAKAGTLTVP